MTLRVPDPAAVPGERAERAEPGDDPFARAAGAGEVPAAMERSVTIVGPLAQRDPDAPAEDSAEFDVGAASFDDLLGRARWRGFLAGAVAGALGAAVAALGVSWIRSGMPDARPTPEPRPLAADARVEAPRTRAPASEPAAAVREDSRPARAAGKRRLAVAAVDAKRANVAPGLSLRPAEEPSGGPSGPAARSAPAPRRLEGAEVASALSARREEIQACAAAHPADVARAGGRRFHLVLTIDETGSVAARLDDAEIAATALGACLVRVGGDVRFAPYDGDPVRVDLPLRFASAE